MNNPNKNYKYMEQLAKVQAREINKPKTPAKQLVKSEKQSSPVLSEHAKELTIWEDVLWAIMNQTSGQIKDRIKKIRDQPARQKFQKITDELFYLQMRNNNLKRKLDSLNDLLKLLTDHKILKPDVKIQEDNLQQIDIEAVRKLIKLTNQCKILASLVETNGKEPAQQPQALKAYADCRSVAKLKSIISNHDYYSSIYQTNPPKDSQLKIQIESLKKTLSQLERDKKHLHQQLMANLPGCTREGYSNPKGGIKLTQPKPIDLKMKPDQGKLTLLQLQYDELKNINAKLTRDQGLLTGVAKRHQSEAQRYRTEEARLRQQLDKITINSKNQIERLENTNCINLQELSFYKARCEWANQERNDLQNQNKILKKEIIQKQEIIMSQRKEYQRVIQEVTINCEQLAKKQKALKIKIQQLQRQLQTQKIRYRKLNDDKILIEQSLKRTLQDKDIQNENIFYIRQQFQGKINKLQIQVEKLNKKVKENQTEKHSFTKQLQQSKLLAHNQIISLKKQHEQANNQEKIAINELSIQNNNLNARIEQILDNKQRQWEELSDHHKMQIASKDKQISELKDKIQIQEQQILTLNKRLQTLNENINKLESRNQYINQQLQDLIGQRNTSSSHLQSLENDNHRLVKENQSKQAQLLQLLKVKDQLVSLQLQLKQKQSIKDDADQIKRLKQCSQRLKSELIDKEKRINQLQQQITTRNDEIQSLKENYEQLLSENNKLTSTRQQDMNKISHLQQQKEILTTSNQQKQVQITVLRSQNQQIRKTIVSLRQSIQTLQSQVIVSNQEKSNLRQQANLKEAQVQQMKSSIQGIQGQLDSQIQKCIDLQTIKGQIENEKRKIEEISNRRQEQLKTQLQRVTRQLEKVKSELQNEKNQYFSLIQRLQLSQYHCKDLKAEKNFIEKQFADNKLKKTKQQYVNDSISIIQLGQSADPATNTQNAQSFIMAEQLQRQEELDVTKKELAEYKQKLVDEQVRLGELERQKESSQRQREGKIRQLGQDIERLSSENAGLKENIQALRIQYNRQCEQSKKQNADLKRQIDEMLGKERESQERFGQMINNCTQQSDRQIKQLKQTIARLQYENAELKASKLKLDDAEGRINNIELEKDFLQRQRDLIKAAKEQIEAELQAYNSKTKEQATKFQAIIDEKQGLIDELKDRLRAKDQSLEAAQSQLGVKTLLIAQMNEAQAKFDEKEQSYLDKQQARMNEDKSQNSQIAILQKENEALKMAIQKKQSEITSITESYEQLQKSYDDEAREHQEAKDILERQIDNLKLKLESAEMELQKAKLHKGSLLSSLAEKQQESGQNKKRITDLERELSMSQAKITQIQHESKQKLSQKEKQVQNLIQDHQSQIRNYEQRLQQALENTKQKENNSDQQARIKDLQEIIVRMTTENTNYQNTLNIVRNQMALTQKHTVDIIESKDIQINHLAQQIAKLNGDVKILSAKNQQLDKLFDELQTRNDELERENAEMIEKARYSQDRFGDMMNYSMQDYDGKIKVLEDDNALLRTEIQKSQKERQRLQAKNKKYEQQIDDLTHQVQILNQTLQEVNKFNQSMQAKCEEKQKQADMEESAQNMRAVGEKQIEIAELKYYMKKLEEQLIKKENLIGELVLKVERLQKVQDELDFSVGQLNRLRLKEKEYQQTLSLKQGQLVILSEEKQRLKAEQEQYMKLSQQDMHKLEQRLHELEQHLHKVQQELMLREMDKDGTLRGLFQHELLHYHPAYKQFLKESIQQQCNGRIIKTRLVYRYDPINKANFHQYIDNLENLVVIIKLANGSCIAGYTEDSLNVDRRQTQKTGLIMSLTNREVFKLAEPNKRAATYDQYYIIFGNSEIRIKSQEKKIFSNFGISNSYFKSRGFKVETLLGGSPKESQVDFETFEVYQLEIIYDF